MGAWVVGSLRPIAALTVLALVAAPLPRWVGAAVGAALGLFVAATVPAVGAVASIDAALILSELAIGAALGLVAALPLVALGWSAALVDTAAGEPGARAIVMLAGAAVFVGIDGPAMLAASIVHSYGAV